MEISKEKTIMSDQPDIPKIKVEGVSHIAVSLATLVFVLGSGVYLLRIVGDFLVCYANKPDVLTCFVYELGTGAVTPELLSQELTKFGLALNPTDITGLLAKIPVVPSTVLAVLKNSLGLLTLSLDAWLVGKPLVKAHVRRAIPNHESAEFVDFVKKWMVESNITSQQLADLAGLGYTTVLGFLAKRADSRDATLAKIRTAIENYKKDQ